MKERLAARLTARNALWAALGVGVAFLFVTPGPPPSPANLTWGERWIDGTPRVIFLSAHFGQVVGYLTEQLGKLVDAGFTAKQALALVSQLMGVLYLAAAFVIARGLAPRRGLAFFAVAALSPITVFLHGDPELGPYPFPFLHLVVGLAFLWPRDVLAERRVILSVLGGIAAALHGLGLFYLPGIVALHLRPYAGIWRRPADLALRVLEAGGPFFGVTGALIIYYLLRFPIVAFGGGDANGGTSGGLFLPLIGSMPAHQDFRAYSFWSVLHATDVVAWLALGCPALLVLVLGDGRRWWREDVRAWPELWLLAGVGVALQTFAYIAATIFIAASGGVPALSLAQTLALRTLADRADTPAARARFAIGAVASLAATTLLWARLAARLY